MFCRLPAMGTLMLLAGILLPPLQAQTNEEPVDSAAVAPGDASPAAEVPPSDTQPASTEAGSADAADSAAEHADVVRPLSQRPYLVTLHLSLTGRGRVSRMPVDRLREQVRQAIRRMYGGMWQMTLASSDWLEPGTPGQIERLTVDDIYRGPEHAQPRDRYPEQQTHKVMFVAVAGTTAGFDVACREYDTRTHDLSPVLTSSTPDVRGIAPAAARLLRDCFRPYLEYVHRYSDDDGFEYLELQTQAGEIPPPDPTAEQVRTNDVLRPFMRRMDRRDPNKLHRLQALALTYLRVTDVDLETTRGLTTAVLLTHGRVSPFGQRRRNMTYVALRQRATADSSRVRLVDRSADQRPLICQRMSVVYKLRVGDSDDREQLRLLTDRSGEVMIPADPDFPTLWLYVYSGRLLLARVPYAPGLLPVDNLTLPDDSIRLSVEGDLQLLRDDVIDAVAMREVHFSLARRAAAEGRAEDLEQHLQDYVKMPGLTEFSDSLTLLRVDALNRAEQQRNRHAARTVRRMCRGMEDTLQLFFSEAKRVRRLELMDDLRAQVKLNPPPSQ